MRSSKINYMIFYGTLMSGGSRGRVRDGIEYVQDITLKGELYNVGAFPALIMGHSDVHAELYEITDSSVIEGTFDHIEGYSGSKDHDLYTRTLVYVPEIEDVAWVYTFNSSVMSMDKIESGNWNVRH